MLAHALGKLDEHHKKIRPIGIISGVWIEHGAKKILIQSKPKFAILEFGIDH